jgi:hypothetical protein
MALFHFKDFIKKCLKRLVKPYFVELFSALLRLSALSLGCVRMIFTITKDFGTFFSIHFFQSH